MHNKILDVVVQAVNELNNSLDIKLPVHHGKACPLYSDSVALDSISLVTLIVNVEQSIEDKFGLPLILANEKAMSRRNSPFLTVGTLTNYILELVKEGKSV